MCVCVCVEWVWSNGKFLRVTYSFEQVFDYDFFVTGIWKVVRRLYWNVHSFLIGGG